MSTTVKTQRPLGGGFDDQMEQQFFDEARSGWIEGGYWAIRFDGDLSPDAAVTKATLRYGLAWEVMESMTTKERDALAKGDAPEWREPPAKGQRCPRCHVTDNQRECSLCNPFGVRIGGTLNPTEPEAFECPGCGVMITQDGPCCCTEED